MRLGYVAIWPPEDPRSWGGTPYFSCRSLRDVDPELTVISTPVFDRVLRCANKISRRLFKMDLLREPLVQKAYSFLVDRQIQKHDLDVVVSLGATHKLCRAQSDIGIVHVSDALYRTIIEAYSYLCDGSSERSKRLGHALQDDFVKRVDWMCLSSDWAVDGAQRDYDLSQCHVEMVPFGANLETDPLYDPTKRSDQENLSLLFIGGNWERKGGPFLLDVFRELKKHTPDIQLHIVGCTPTIEGDADGIAVHGFLRKSDPEELKILDELYRTSSFLTLFSREEANAMVFAEAGAYGLPVAASNAGGIGTSVVHGDNGLLLSLDDDPRAYAQAMLELWNDHDAYLAMAQRGRLRYENHLCWSAWADRVHAVAQQVHASRTKTISLATAEGRSYPVPRTP